MNKKNIPTESQIEEGQVVETIKPKSEQNSGETGVKIKRGKVDSLSIFEVSESELTTIENGSSNSLFLNFSIFLLSIATSFLIALLTSDYKDKQTIFIVFLLFTIVGFIGGSFLLILWFKKKDDFKDTISEIRGRME